MANKETSQSDQDIPGLSSPAAFLVFYRNNPKHCAGSCDKSRIAFQMTSWTEVLASEWEEETIHYITVLGAVIHFELQMLGMDLWQCLTENSWVMRCLNLRDVYKWMPFRSIKFIHVIYCFVFYVYSYLMSYSFVPASWACLLLRNTIGSCQSGGFPILAHHGATPNSVTLFWQVSGLQRPEMHMMHVSMIVDVLPCCAVTEHVPHAPIKKWEFNNIGTSLPHRSSLF